VAVQDFLKCLNLYAQEIISRQELLNLAHVSLVVGHVVAGEVAAGSMLSTARNGPAASCSICHVC
jgi:hypothetical protein